jgi:hypothetical protein
VQRITALARGFFDHGEKSAISGEGVRRLLMDSVVVGNEQKGRHVEGH